MCCSPWGHKGSDTTEQLNGTELSGAGGGVVDAKVRLIRIIVVGEDRGT